MSYHQGPPTQVIYHGFIAPRINGFAIAALVLGILAAAAGIWTPIPFIGIVFGMIATLPGILAIVFGYVGLGAWRRLGVGRGSAIAGLVLGWVAIGIILVTTLAWVIAIASSIASSTVRG